METVLLELAAVVITIVVFLMVANVTSRTRERRALESGMYPQPGEGTDSDVRRLVMSGEHMLAIKLYREIHHVGLKEARDAIDTLRDRYRTR
jgi:ribosomal protein L7/L12